MKTFTITHRGRDISVLLDDEDYEKYHQYKWRWAGGYVHCNRLGAYIHNLIMGGKGVDHIDGNPFNNQKSNLRFATNSQNLLNRGPQENNTSGMKGVSFYRRTGKWRAFITVSGEQHHLGFFDNKDKAAEAYVDAAKKLAGEFARTT